MEFLIEEVLVQYAQEQLVTVKEHTLVSFFVNLADLCQMSIARKRWEKSSGCLSRWNKSKPMLELVTTKIGLDYCYNTSTMHNTDDFLEPFIPGDLVS